MWGDAGLINSERRKHQRFPNLGRFFAPYGDGLRRIIDAKIAGEDIVVPEIQDPPKVVDLMEALRRSLDSVSTTKKKPAKVTLATSRGSKAKSQKPRGVRKAAAG